MNTRIKELRFYLKLTQKEFSNNIGMQPSSLCDIEKGNAPITERTILIICSQYNVNEKWLRFGEGEMFNTIDKKYDEFFSVYNSLNEPLQDFLIQTAKNLLDTQKKL